MKTNQTNVLWMPDTGCSPQAWKAKVGAHPSGSILLTVSPHPSAPTDETPRRFVVEALPLLIPTVLFVASAEEAKSYAVNFLRAQLNCISEAISISTSFQKQKGEEEIVFCCGEPIVAGEKMVKARKSHQCVGCEDTIKLGDTYFFFREIYHGEWSRYQMCIRCKDRMDVEIQESQESTGENIVTEPISIPDDLWQDKTRPNQCNNKQLHYIYEAQFGQTRLTISHSFSEGGWVASATPFFSTVELGVLESQCAKDKAVAILCEEVEASLTQLADPIRQA